jgi:putative aldouronate transport system permease protein
MKGEGAMNKYLKSPGEFFIKSMIVICMLFTCVVTLYPFWYIFVASFSIPNEVVKTSGLMIWFKGFDLYAYKEVFSHRLFMRSYGNTMIYLLSGVTTNMIMTTLAAYGLSRRELVGKGAIMKIIVFTMFFGGGLIPTYIVVDNLKMTDTLWSQFIPYAINTYNLIILRTAFQAVPFSLEEAAKIDGASPAQIMVKITLPLAIPSIMVIGLYYAVEIWNSYFRALIYIRSSSKYPLQLILRQILLADTMEQADQAFVSTNIGLTVKYATIIVSTLPILMVYPFIQRYFVQGVMIGSIKG